MGLRENVYVCIVGGVLLFLFDLKERIMSLYAGGNNPTERKF